jgi:TatD DNase family protein
MIDSDPKIYFTSGFHPAFAAQFRQIPKDTIETLIQHPKNVAIGEIGLDDLNHFSVPLVKQELAFIGLMKLAKKYDQPVVLHLATKQQSTYQIFRDLVTQHLGLNYKVYFHCSGKMRYKWLKELVSLFPMRYFGLNCETITETNLSILNQCKILLESDSPYFVPKSISRQIEISIFYSSFCLLHSK